MNYQLEISPAAQRDLKKLAKQPGTTLQRIRDVIDELETDPRPHGVKKLQGEENLYRIRVGDYRIIYSIEEKKLIVLVIRIGHRRDIYKK